MRPKLPRYGLGRVPRIGALLALAVLLVAAAGVAALDKTDAKRGRWSGKTADRIQRTGNPTDIYFVITRKGNLRDIRFPTACDSTYHPVIKKARVSRTGRFSAYRRYIGSNSKRRKFDWKLRFSGKLISRRRAKGKLSYSARLLLDGNHVGDCPESSRGQVGKTTWKARHKGK